MPQVWKIPQIWDAATAVVMGTGPSLNLKQLAHIYLARCHGACHFVVAVNNNYQAAPWADYLYACDYKFFTWHKHHLPEAFKGAAIVSCDRPAAEEFAYILWVPGEHADGLSTNPELIHYGKNSGYQAVNLAYLLGARRILLVGFDHQYPNNAYHWYGEHPDRNRSSWYERWMPCWQTVLNQLNDLDLEIINCTPESALHVFPKARLNEALKW